MSFSASVFDFAQSPASPAHQTNRVDATIASFSASPPVPISSSWARTASCHDARSRTGFPFRSITENALSSMPFTARAIR